MGWRVLGRPPIQGGYGSGQGQVLGTKALTEPQQKAAPQASKLVSMRVLRKARRGPGETGQKGVQVVGVAGVLCPQGQEAALAPEPQQGPGQMCGEVGQEPAMGRGVRRPVLWCFHAYEGRNVGWVKPMLGETNVEGCSWSSTNSGQPEKDGLLGRPQL